MAAHLPELGVGVVYSSALEPLLDAAPELINVLEVEPQTSWIETRNAESPYLVRADIQEHLASLPGDKLVHSIGTPVGGSVAAHAAQIPLLRQTIEHLHAPWASEHLSFNLTPDFFTGFFLPPRQSDAGLKTYVEAIKRLRDGVGVPLAIETGVNYLRPRPDEIPDGEFISAVAEAADCGILLDLHNVYCNELNGRQTVERFLTHLPLERVWEVHLAGGFELEGYWLDAHSGAIPDRLEGLARDVIASLPELKAIIFEIFSSFLPHFGLDATRGELEKLHALWALRGSHVSRGRTRSVPAEATEIGISPAAWERALGSLVIGRAPSTALGHELASDPGVPLVAGARQGVPRLDGGRSVPSDQPAADARAGSGCVSRASGGLLVENAATPVRGNRG